MLEYFKKFDISQINLFKGCLRLSLLTSLLAFTWCFFIEAPKHTNIAFGISDQDARDLRKAASIEIDGHKYSYEEGKEYKNGIKTENKYKINELDESCITDDEKNEVIKKCIGYWHCSRSNDYECTTSFFCDNIMHKALERIVKNETFIDFSTGYLVNNKKYGIKNSSWTLVSDGDHYVSVYYSPDGYSIVPSLKEKIKYCLEFSTIYVLFALLFTTILLPLIGYCFYFSLITPLVLISKLYSYFYWVKKGFI
jgi:hypothetical protein